MSDTIRTSADFIEEYIPGELLREHRAESPEDVFIQLLRRPAGQDSIFIPAVPEPMLVWIVSGQALVEERCDTGPWKASQVGAGDFFLTTSPVPTELRWRTNSDEPFCVMHLYLGLSRLKRAIRDVTGQSSGHIALREVSGERDATLSMLLQCLKQELMLPAPSASFIQGISQSLTVLLVRSYAQRTTERPVPRGGLQAYKLHRIFEAMKLKLADAFDLGELATLAELSPFHFSRAFKQSTGWSPSRYFMRLRIEQARKLLCETEQSVIQVCLAVGYSSPSHFSDVFRKETGVTPSEYRGRHRAS